jgi:hypothetical protein
MVSAIASRKYERAGLSRLFRFTLAIQPTVQAEHRTDREVTMWPTRCSRPWAFPKGNLTLFLGVVSPLARPSVGRVEASTVSATLAAKPPKAAGAVARKRGDPNFQSCSEFLIWSHAHLRVGRGCEAGPPPFVSY